MPDKPNCPNCGRPIGFEYITVEPGKCQLWRWINECNIEQLSARTLSDCFARTSQRIRELTVALADAQAVAKAAQRALSRHHESAAKVKDEPFRDNARIE